jgi:Cu2+-exporting ATPase
LGDRRVPVAVAVGIARRAKSVMRENLALAVGYNAVGVPIAMLGFVSPVVDVVAMSDRLYSLPSMHCGQSAQRGK